MGRQQHKRYGEDIQDWQEQAVCPGCLEMLPVGMFGKDAKYVDGKRLYCRGCTRERAHRARMRVRRVLVMGPSRSYVGAKMRARLDKAVAKGEVVLVVTLDGKVFEWGKRLRRYLCVNNGE